jgi:hypothetical protein
MQIISGAMTEQALFMASSTWDQHNAPAQCPSTVPQHSAPAQCPSTVPQHSAPAQCMHLNDYKYLEWWTRECLFGHNACTWMTTSIWSGGLENAFLAWRGLNITVLRPYGQLMLKESCVIDMSLSMIDISRTENDCWICSNIVQFYIFQSTPRATSKKRRTAKQSKCYQNWDVASVWCRLPTATVWMHHKRLPRHCKYCVTIIDDITRPE